MLSLRWFLWTLEGSLHPPSSQYPVRTMQHTPACRRQLRAQICGHSRVGFQKTTTLDLESALEAEVDRILGSEVGRFKVRYSVIPWWSWKLRWPESDITAFSNVGALGPISSVCKKALLGILRSREARGHGDGEQRFEVHRDGLAAHHPGPSSCCLPFHVCYSCTLYLIWVQGQPTGMG